MSAGATIPPLPVPGTNFRKLPAALAPLQAEDRWLVWRWEIMAGKSGRPDRLTKVPYVADAPGRKARSNDRRTWRSFEAAVAAVEAGRAHGVGASLADGKWGSFDLDDCRDPATGALEEWSEVQVADSASYAEVTISGTGLRIIGLAEGSEIHRNQRVPDSPKGKIETYRRTARFIVVTGDHLPGSPDALANIDAQIDRTVAWLDEAAREAKGQKERPEAARSDEDRRRDLSGELLRLIECGAPEGERSEKFMHVVGWLKDYGRTAPEIVALLARHPAGIAEKYGNRLEVEVHRCWNKAETKARNSGKRRKRPKPGPSPSDEDGSPDERSVIAVVAGQVPRVVDETEAALIAAGAPIYTRAGSLVRPVIEAAAASKGGTTLTTRFKPMCPASMSDHAARVARYQRFDMRSEDWMDINPPKDAILALLARDGEWRLPAVAGIVTTPTLRPDGTILSEAGYDPATRLLLVLAEGFHLPSIQERPTREDAERALRLLTDLISDFPFVAPIDRAVALSGILTAVARGALSVTPLHAINAHTPGTGKSYLVDVISTIATGRRSPVIAAGKTEEETEKRLVSLLLNADPIVSIDNVNGELGGDTLCQMTERPMVRVRILGTSDAPEIECCSTVFATGNNLTLIGDMTRRTITCALDAKVERPELREFAFKPEERVLADRGAYVAAALTIVLAYRAAGAPSVCGPVGSYEVWSDMVRAPLIWLGEADPVDSMETARAEDPELSAIRELFGHWRDHPLLHLNSAYSVNGIIQVACEQAETYGSFGREFKTPEFRDLLLRVAGRGSVVNSNALGLWFKAISGRVVSGGQLHVRLDPKRCNKYSLVFNADAVDPDDWHFAHAAE